MTFNAMIEDNPYALPGARDAAGNLLAQVRMAPSFKLNSACASTWVQNGFRKSR
jgi:hypothetical protein